MSIKGGVAKTTPPQPATAARAMGTEGDLKPNSSQQQLQLQDGEDHDIVEWFEEIAENASAVQTQILKRIINLNRDTHYLTKWLGSERVIDLDLDDLDPDVLHSLYTSLVPLASHSDLEPYIQGIADGDTSPLLTAEPITMLSLSSGTTDGRPKSVPFTRFSAYSTLQIFRLAAAYRSRVYPIRVGGRILEFIYSSKQFATKGGLTAGLATAHYYASEEFKTKQKRTRSFTCSPYEVISGGDYKQTTYCHLLLGLIFRNQVEFVTSTFAYSLVQAFCAFQELWPEICDDIRYGKLSNTRVNLPQMRNAVLLDYLTHPNPALASEVERKCRELKASDWECVIPKLWPNAKYIYSIMTGSMQPYLRKLRHYAGHLPLVCADYGSTESWIGVNLGPSDPPEQVKFTVIPTFSYFEFIPLSTPKSNKQQQQLAAAGSLITNISNNTLANDDFDEGEPVPLSKVKLGEQYEIVLTTFTGLYRYRLGDVVEVAGFYKGVPQLSFICRRKLILTVNVDKNTEKDLQLVVEKGSSLLSQKSKTELVDFTSYANASRHDHPGHYVIYWEIVRKQQRTKNMNVNIYENNEEEQELDEVLKECCNEMDAAFVDHGYVMSRKSNSIGPLELRIVEGGTFSKILEHCIGNGAAMSQFKTPRCTTNNILLSILDRSTVKRFTSTAYAS